ncbi:MAG TPA: alpha/beta hydrolase [Terriglobales bacterium]
MEYRRRTSAIVTLAALLVLSQGCATHPEKMSPGKFPEQLVYARTNDDVVDAGVMFTPPRDSAKPIALIWIHGWGVNFYSPTYVAIGRALSERGYTTISANTRMHDLGNVLQYRGDKRIRGGGYWGIASDQVRDVAAWTDFAEVRGFKQVILVGHSAGWAAVTQYDAETQDPRVVGIVVASGLIHTATPPTDPDQIAQANRMMAEGRPDDLVKDPKRSFPSFISAGTMLDMVNSPPELKDFWGTQTATRNPAVTRIRCPLLAFFGTRGDVGGEKELELLKSSIQRQTSGPARVDTVMIKGTDHMYQGEEVQVAETIAKWVDSLSQK